jgi:hypothetical protein
MLVGGKVFICDAVDGLEILCCSERIKREREREREREKFIKK